MLQQLQFHQASISGGRSGDHLAHDPTLPSSVPGGRRKHLCPKQEAEILPSVKKQLQVSRHKKQRIGSWSH
jgi:hypothetical protein